MAETILLIGTRKGLVVARSRDDRRSWSLDDLAFANLEVYSVGVDARRDPVRLFAGAGSGHWGPKLSYSDDLGRSWVEPTAAPIAFPSGSDTALVRVWQIQPAPAAQPDVVYAGVEPHALFRSDDGGVSFSLVQGLWTHPHRKEWVPGNGGACLHTVVPHPTDPGRMWVALSAGGVYRTDDGGATWTASNRGIQSYWLPEDQRFPEFGQCVHRLSLNPDRPERLFAQNHFGVYRSVNSGDSWEAIESGLPHNFGFPILVHPRQPDTVFAFPLKSDGERMPSDGRCRVYRTRDAGASWHPLAGGLPDDPYYGAVLRDAMCADSSESTGLYFGTRLGEVYATRDDGESWSLVARHLPDVMSIRAAVVP